MKKVVQSSWWEEYKVPVAIVATVVVLSGLEYIFGLPSSLFRSSETPDSPLPITVQVSGEVIPEKTCSTQGNTVCGKDGKTYANACLATKAHTDVQKLGKCDTDASVEVDTGMEERSHMLDANVPTETISSSEHDASLLTNTGMYHVYANEKLKYRFALPKYAYYQGFGARDGALHTVGVGLTASGAESFETSDVRLWYYKKAPTNASGTLFSFSG